MPRKVSIVLSVFNRVDDTKRFLADIARIDYPNFEAIVVDDGSTDGTFETITRAFPWVRLLRTKGDLWSSKSMNLGILDALRRGTDYVLIMTNDIDFEPDFLTELVQYAEKHSRTLVQPIVRDSGDRKRVWCVGGKIRYWTGQTLMRRDANDGRLEWTSGTGF